MTKAEKKALEAYPVCMCYNYLAQCEGDINKESRISYQEGYEQAEKDDFEDSLKSDMTVFKKMQDRIIDKACEWIRYNNENGGCLFDGWEKDFKKAMEDKQ